MKQKSLVSIILPTYNGAKTIQRTLQSVIAQEYPLWELIVVDDASTDNTKEIVMRIQSQEERIRYIPHDTNKGIQAALTTGLVQARGKYIARIDDDDVWMAPEKLGLQVLFLENNPEYVLVGTGAIIIDEAQNEISRYLLPETDIAIRKSIMGKNCFVHSSVLFTKEVASICGGYSQSKDALHVEDHELWLKLGQRGKFYNIPQYLVHLTERTGSLTSSNRVLQARNMVVQGWKFRMSYPNFLKGYVVSLLRLSFFFLVSALSLKGVWILKIKSMYKS